MKHTIVFLTLLVSIGSFSQTSESDKVKATIERFFEGFHKQDSTIILETVGADIKMQSIGKNTEGKAVLSTSDFQKFLKSIIAIPKDKKFKEAILGYNIQIDGDMANAWTPYKFWFDGNFSHCGVNSFQLFKDEGTWKIIYLIDTRRRDCKED
ncbi:nuclear transport factor 2 family protein [Psychroserpens sp. SPM9]|uniref:nuclear transport factor 2 family protein n=1 Tax=Psychroserpens sp. SPM9 TaxID=2975598 RepID=UPI0021A8D7F7|nr:nuclear transport factor 2 family protein [Psychroserpens sp. SPM9]MDG5491822.1 nuclear transport factor 2 family protein [Psychroserpens sp. SPM9]